MSRDGGGVSGAGNVVVVDDDPGTLKLIKILLEVVGCDVRTFTGGLAALRSIETERPDLVLLDIRLPEMNGFEICGKLKSNPDTAPIPVVFLSGATEVEDKVKGFRVGGIDYLTKPFEREELLARVRTHISLFRASQEIRRISEELARKELRYRLGFEGSPVGIAVVDANGTALEVNQAFADMVGKPAELIAGHESIESLSAPGETPANLAVKDRMVSGLQPMASIQTAILDKNGRRIPVKVDAARVDSDSDPVIFAFITDLTDIEEKNQQLAYLAERDPLTGALNRRGFLEHVRTSLAECASEDRSCAVLFIDIDGFKMINDVYGHRIGDRFLCAIANRLIENTKAELGQVGRLGGDEFAVLLPASAPSHVAGVVRRLERSVGEPMIVDGVTLAASCSIGQAVSDGSALNCEELMARADQDMYATRRARRGGLARKVEELRSALEAGQLLTYLQPIWRLSADGRSLHGYETLLRWQHPAHGLVPPQEFIHTAEAGGLIYRLDLWAATQALHRLVSRPELKLAINCSALTLACPGMAHELVAAVKAVNRDPKSLIVELTESVDIPDNSQIMKTLNELRREGMRIALDDFGTGYAGLNNLRTLPIDIVKIDRSLVATLADESSQADNTEHFLSGIRQLTHAMGIELLAEGIETPHQLDVLQKLEFNYAQGFLLGRPSSEEVPRDLMRARVSTE